MSDSSFSESGLSRVVLYPKGGVGEPWSGVGSISASPTFEEAVFYVDGLRYARSTKTSGLSGTIDAYHFPDHIVDGWSGRPVDREFDLVFETHRFSGRQIHFLYGLKFHEIGSKTEHGVASMFELSYTSRPVAVPYFRPTSHFVFDLSWADQNVVLRLEEILYGNDIYTSTLPPISELLDIFEEQSILIIYDHGDGTWSAQGPDDVILILDSTTFSIDWPSATYISEDEYRIHSL